jgi:2-amino-4-hydroxy-6-hydroxymethyldihydropteridine diphosphokinase
MSVAYVALGGNLGDRLATIESAIRAVAENGDVTAISSIYETDPVGFEDQPAFLNAVIELETQRTPEELLDALQSIEQQHGRQRTFPNAPRTLDLDLLLYGNEQRSSSQLTLPHPRLHERAFVLVPLAEIAPDMLVTGHAASVAALLSRIDAKSGIRKAGPPPWLPRQHM